MKCTTEKLTHYSDGNPSSPAWVDCYTDADGDGYGDLNSPQTVTFDDFQSNPDLCVIDAGDCDDTNPAINPGQEEILANGIDDDCNSATPDEATSPDESPTAPDETTPIIDNDGDGYASGVDCDDNNATVYPGAPEPCDGIDNNCDGVVDEDATDIKTWFVDADGDGYGSASSTKTACDQPEGYSANDDDCDDNDEDINPGETDDPATIVHEDCTPIPIVETHPLFPSESDGENNNDTVEPTYEESVFLRGLSLEMHDKQSTKFSGIGSGLIYSTPSSSQFIAHSSLSTPDNLSYKQETYFSSAQYDTSIMQVVFVHITGESDKNPSSIEIVSLVDTNLEGFDQYAIALVKIEMFDKYIGDSIKWGVVEARARFWNPTNAQRPLTETINATDPSVAALKTLYPHISTRFEGSSTPAYHYNATLAIIGIKTSEGAIVKTGELETGRIQNGATDTVTKGFGTYDNELEYLPLLNKMTMDVSTGWIDTAAKVRQVQFAIDKKKESNKLKISLSGVGDFHNNADDIIYTTGVTVLGIPTDKLTTWTGTATSNTADSITCHISDTVCPDPQTSGDTQYDQIPDDHAPELVANCARDDRDYHPGDDETFTTYTDTAECSQGFSITLTASDEDVENGGAAPKIRGFVDQDYMEGYLVDVDDQGDDYPYNTNHDVAQIDDSYFTEEGDSLVFTFSFSEFYALDGGCAMCDPLGMHGVKFYFDATDGEKTTGEPITFELQVFSNSQCE